MDVLDLARPCLHPSRGELGNAPQTRSTRSWLLAASKACSDIDNANRIHGEAVAAGFEQDVVVSSAMVTMYAKCGSLRDACSVFQTIPRNSRDLVSWTALMLAFANNGAEELALQLFADLVHSSHIRPDARSLVVAVKACIKLAAREKTKLASVERGMALHALAARTGLELQLFVASSFVDMYSKCGCMDDAARLFHRMPAPNVVSWTALILGYANNGDGVKSLELLERMILVCLPNSQTLVAALKACSILAPQEDPRTLPGEGLSVKVAALERGFAIHSRLIPLVDNHVLVANALLDLYAKCGSMKDARRVFDSIPDGSKTVVSWNALMLGYVHNGNAATALEAFTEMKETGSRGRLLDPDTHTFVILVTACGSCAAMELGRSMHGEACRRGMLELPSELSSSMVNSLLDFYAKCGSLVHAQALLDSCASRDFVTWSALLDGYARQGDMDHLFATLRQMTDEALHPNSVTFLSLLTACSHAGRVDRCEQLLASIPSKLRTLEHYHAVIDALGRANQLQAAVRVVETMPFAPDAVTWHTLLSAARKWSDLSVASRAFQMLQASDPTYAYAASGYALVGNAITY